MNKNVQNFSPEIRPKIMDFCTPLTAKRSFTKINRPLTYLLYDLDFRMLIFENDVDI
jgi:hypothetical protein